MGKIIDFSGAPQAPFMSLPINQMLAKQSPSKVVVGNQGQDGLEVVMVQRD